jgi:hypothetical protein
MGMRAASFQTVLLDALISLLLGVPVQAVAASPDTSQFPVLSREQMNCGDTTRTDDSRLNELQAHAIALSLNHVYEAEVAQSTTKSYPHAKHLDGYILLFCAISNNGRHFIIVNGIYKFLGATVCDDAAGFGVMYDPKIRRSEISRSV